MKSPFIVLCGVFATLFTLSSFALKSDQNQPATLDADEFELDFQTGVRTYRGNVVYQQGTIRLFADEIVAYFKDDVLERAIARGNPAKFKQRPEDSNTDVVGTALRIEMDDKKQIVILKDRAKVTQDKNTITGKTITYDMKTEKVKVKSGKRKPARVAEKPVSNQVNQLEAALEEAKKDIKAKMGNSGLKDEGLKQPGSDRPRLVIQPRKK